MEEVKQHALKFMKNQKLLVLASSDKSIWTSNVFYGVDEDFTMYFISSMETKHSMQIMKNSSVAFSIPWFNPQDHTDRKAIQGTGICRRAKSQEEIAKCVSLHNSLYPEFAKRITVDWINSDENKSTVWVIKPGFLKYWDDQLYGNNGTREFAI